MSKPTADAETEGDLSRATEGDTTASPWQGFDRRTGVGTLVGIALLSVVSNTGVRILANMPFDPVSVPATLRAVLEGGAPLTVAVALAAIALSDRRPTVRVGLLFAAVFGMLGVVVPTTVLPALVALAGGSALALSGTLGRPESRRYRALRRRGIAAGFVLAIACSLAAATGLAGSAVHTLGTALALLSVGAVGTRSAGSLVAVGAGAFAVVALVAVSATSPFILGSVLLVAFAVTGVPHVLVGLAVGAAVAAVVAGLLRREYALALGGGLLLFAGAPVTLPRALTLLLGATLVLLDTFDPEPATRTEVTG
jgi:hypothetical protein